MGVELWMSDFWSPYCCDSFRNKFYSKMIIAKYCQNAKHLVTNTGLLHFLYYFVLHYNKKWLENRLWTKFRVWKVGNYLWLKRGFGPMIMIFIQSMKLDCGDIRIMWILSMPSMTKDFNEETTPTPDMMIISKRTSSPQIACIYCLEKRTESNNNNEIECIMFCNCGKNMLGIRHGYWYCVYNVVIINMKVLWTCAFRNVV